MLAYMSNQGMPDYVSAAKRANAKLQRLENQRAAAEGRAPRDLRADMLARRQALRENQK